MKLWIWSSLVAVILIGSGVGVYFLYQNHLSDDVKRLLIAANDEQASQMEVRQYVAQIRPTYEKTLSLIAGLAWGILVIGEKLERLGNAIY